VLSPDNRGLVIASVVSVSLTHGERRQLLGLGPRTQGPARLGGPDRAGRAVG